MAPIPQTMNGVQISRTGGVEVLEYRTDLPVPTLAEGQVLVRNAYAGVNFIDTYFRTGLYKAPLPLTLGREGAGTVGRLSWAPSAPTPPTPPSPAASLVRVPDAVTDDQAAAVLLQGLTAWTFVREAAEVKPRRMLRAVGAKVIGAASTDAKCALARDNGAEWTVNSSEQDLVAEVARITAGHGADVVFDGIGKATFDSDLQLAARKGRLVIFGNASGAVPPFDILKLGQKNLKIMRPVVNNYTATPDELAKYAGELFDMITSGKLKIAIHKVYPIQDVKSAHTDIESRKTTGKLILKHE
ncbi:zinc-binding dehydrogenase [Colletotrichum graminicola M1.001]|uniref:Zinc-binding dehydrogenase n=1 Tax=Colletotrichum graminicola (strain M1.001 / M2 / FGSC 10212) TaxID=645133 RepID=E3QMF4_COLGM|nr:zinc-binding dehydrogenase [Colletotrichum graminicola M1.001]EFQ32042.1 zinc-binding dehydrogenase [Colletotrichum graminicola M1.001]